MEECDVTCVAKTPARGAAVGASPAELGAGGEGGAAGLAVLVTTNGIGVAMHSALEGSCSHSLAAPAGVDFVCPAVHQPASAAVFAVVADQTALCWSLEGAQAFDECPSLELEGLPQGLHTAEQYPGAVAVLQDGTVQQLRLEAGELVTTCTTAPPQSSGSRSVRWSHLVYDRAIKQHQLLVVTELAGPGALEVTMLQSDPMSGDLSRTAAWQLEQPATTPPSPPFAAAFAFQWPSKLLVLWSTGRVVEYELNTSTGAAEGNGPGPTAAAQLFAEITSLQLPSALPGEGEEGEGGVCLAPLGNRHIGVLGREAGGSTLELQVYDSTYRVLQRRIHLTGLPKKKRAERILSLAMPLKSEVIVSTSRGVYHVACEITKSTLANVLGVLGDTTTPALGEEHGVDKGVLTAVNALLSTKINTAEKFEARFAVVMTRLADSSSSDTKPVLPEPICYQLVARICDEERFFPGKSVRTLLKRGYISHGAYPDLLDEVLGRGSELVARLYFERVQDIPESAAIDCLIATWEEQADKADGKAWFVLGLLARTCWSEEMIVPALKRLTLDQTMDVLSCVSSWLDAHAGESRSEESGQPKSSAHPPSLVQVVTWLGHVLDAHFTTLTMTEDSYPLLTQLSEQLSVHSAISEGLWPLKGVLEHLKRKQNLPSHATTNGLYSQEVLHLS